MSNNLLVLQNKITNIENVRALLYTYSDSVKYNYSNHRKELNFIVILEELNNYPKVINHIKENCNVILEKIIKKEYKKSDLNDSYNIYIYNSLIDDRIIEIIFTDKNDFRELIKREKEFEILVDKDDLLFEHEKLKDIVSKYYLDEDEFLENAVTFFLKLTKAGLAIDSKNWIKAKVMMSDVFDSIIELANFLVEEKYNSKIMLNDFGYNLDTYLDKESYIEILKIVVNDENLDKWTMLFKSAQIYRKLSLAVCEKKGYNYPKKEDVQTLDYLRKLYYKEIL